MRMPLRPIIVLLEQIVPKYERLKKQSLVSNRITPPQARMLFLLKEEGPLRVSEIAKILDTPDSNISSICSRLEEAQLIIRKRQTEDQRVVKIHLAEGALPEIEAMAEMRASFYEQHKDLLESEEIKKMMVSLEKLSRLLDVLAENYEGETPVRPTEKGKNND